MAIDGCGRVLLVLSPAALASDPVRSEWQYALTRGSAVTTVLRNLGPRACPPLTVVTEEAARASFPS